MFENDLAMLKVQIKLALREKIYFVYTLLVPIFMVFINKTQYFQDNEALYIYWSYIVVTTVFNGFLINLIKLREGGFFKTLAYLIGSKHSIVLANLLVQVLVVQFEILFFNLTVTIFITHLSLLTFVYGFLVSFLATLLCAAMMSGLLLLKVNRLVFDSLIGLFFFFGIVFLGVHTIGVWNYILTILNPFQLIYGLYLVPCTSWRYQLLVGICTVIYLGLGMLVFRGISVQSRLKSRY